MIKTAAVKRPPRTAPWMTHKGSHGRTRCGIILRANLTGGGVYLTPKLWIKAENYLNLKYPLRSTNPMVSRSIRASHFS